ncbi:predicted protein [Aspergillus nidulans FGSC A4]|uniref:Uncharacterized protein n=1 Tax=Emericella nidulans (strain FGSC A4 / ATCC 38163 / CBS 112.46 / NRRL 194 / M139) TaxID=227321 RepID=Q5B7Z2_EMENI|nr:hypothetical protein [Aspergillus nidulans FGSC A4]EAA63306.1 predicted protein [Aspergillus nidulans FGSC A4]CBF82914.1 TPA: conserved hypothetical protein [Aspergillus nidulans FGSC A4]|eukprot:XP_660942.1 predicted protein [Aspergillus nidulans FGSC A4]
MYASFDVTRVAGGHGFDSNLFVFLKVEGRPDCGKPAGANFMLNQVSRVEDVFETNWIVNVWRCLAFILIPGLDNFFELYFLAFCAYKISKVCRVIVLGCLRRRYSIRPILSTTMLYRGPVFYMPELDLA